MSYYKYFFFLLLSTFYSCHTKKQEVNSKKNPIYSDETLVKFLNRISFADSIKYESIKIKPIQNESIEHREVAFKNDSINILYVENFWKRKNVNTYEMDSVASFLSFNNTKIEKYATDDGLMSILDFSLSNDRIQYYDVGDNTNLFLLKAKSFTSYGHFSDISYGYVIVNNKTENFCFNLSSYNVPNDFYIGKMNNDIIYLDIFSNPINDDKKEYIYEIIPMKLNFKEGTMENIYKNNSIVKIKIAIPNSKDFSKYRIIYNNWRDVSR